MRPPPSRHVTQSRTKLALSRPICLVCPAASFGSSRWRPNFGTDVPRSPGERMAANTLESIQPYVEQLFDDSEVQKQLARATANLRGARSRAGSAKSKKKALQDPTLRRRLANTVQAAVAAGVAIKRGPEKK